MLRGFHFVALLILFPALACSQANSDSATVTFTLDFPGSMPSHYSIRVDRDGASHYESSGQTSQEAEQVDDFTYDFTMSEATRQKIFELAEKAGYFQKDVDSHRKNMAFTGKKTLAYKAGSRSGESTYNYSQNLSVQELTSLFQSLSETLEFGHRLDFDQRYQKLALAEELKRMDQSARTTPLVEIQAIAPILQKIVDDPAVINVSRARAQRLLDGPTARKQ
jgi:hypothetical protein